MAHTGRQLGKRLAVAAGVAGGAAVLGGAAAVMAGYAGYSWWRRNGSPWRGAFEFDGKVVFISGGSRGLGFALAREFLRHGCRVALCARDSGELERAVGKLEAHGHVFAVPADLTEAGAAAAAIAAVRERWQRVDVLVYNAHNAGVMQPGPWEQATEEQFRAAMDLHCWAALRLAQAVLPEMIARGEGRIVNISSIGGLVPVPHMLPYTTSKFALTGLSLGLAAEVRRHGVRVTCVCPFLMRAGSQERVQITGQHQRVFAWFAALGNLPGLSTSASHAARSIVRACRHGDAQVVLSLPGKLAALAQGVAPSTVNAVLGTAARALPLEAAWRCHEQSGHPLPPIEARPQATSGSDPAKSGEPPSPASAPVPPRMHRAGRQFNQS